MKVYTNIEGSNDLTEAKSTFQGHNFAISHIKQSPFVESSQYVATSSLDGTVNVWDSAGSNWNLINTFRHASAVFAMEWIDKDSIASCGNEETQIQIWKINTKEVLNNKINASQPVTSLKLLSNQIHLAVGLVSGEIEIYAISDGSQVGLTLQGHSSDINDFVQLDANTLISSSRDHSMIIWDLTTHTGSFNLTGHNDQVYGLKQVTSSVLASASSDRNIKLWNTTTGNEIRNLSNHTGSITWSVDLLNPQILISGSWDNSIKLWDWTTGECLRTIETDLLFIYSLTVFTSTSSSLISTTAAFTTEAASTEATTAKQPG